MNDSAHVREIEARPTGHILWQPSSRSRAPPVQVSPAPPSIRADLRDVGHRQQTSLIVFGRRLLRWDGTLFREVAMRIATWNTNHWQRAHDKGRQARVLGRLTEAGVAVALLQETGPIDEQRGVYKQLSGLRAGADWGTAIVALSSEVAIKPVGLTSSDGHIPTGCVGSSHPGTIAAARVEFQEEAIIVVSVYGRMYDAGNGTSYASTTMHRIISDLAGVLDCGRNSPEVMIGGDFNCTTQWERPRDRLMDASVFERLRAHDMVDLVSEQFPDREKIDCFCAEPASCKHVRTLRHRDKADSRPFQCDYMFASKRLAGRSTISLLDFEDVWAISDHCIVAVDIAAL